MNTYRVVWNTTVGGHAWQMDFAMASDEMAIAYTEKLAVTIEDKAFMSLALFKMNEDALDGKFLTSFRVTTTKKAIQQ